MTTVCAWCPKDAPPMHDDGVADGRVSHGICQPHLFAMRAKLTECPMQAAEAAKEAHE